MNGPSHSAQVEGELYALLADTLSFPGASLSELSSSGELRETVSASMQTLGFERGLRLEGLNLGTDVWDLESEYISLFDLPGKSATPLYTGVYASRRRDAMEELLRFYRFFGLTINGAIHDLPDYVPVVLEFLSFLSLSEHPAAAESRAAARNDVLSRHLHPWATQTYSRLEARGASAFYLALVGVVRDVAAGVLDSRAVSNLMSQKVDHPVRVG